MFQPVSIIARALLVSATFTAVALTSQSAASAGALRPSHLWTARHGAVAAAHWFAPRSPAMAARLHGGYVVKW